MPTLVRTMLKIVDRPVFITPQPDARSLPYNHKSGWTIFENTVATLYASRTFETTCEE